MSMKRTIKFRGKCTLNGEWVFGDLEYRRDKDRAFIHTYHEDGKYDRCHEVIPETVGEYTGWTFKHKFELYESDIIGFDDWAFTPRQKKKMRHHVGVIEWSIDYGKWMIKCGDGLFEGNDVADPQLLGNIYDNPELIKE